MIEKFLNKEFEEKLSSDIKEVLWSCSEVADKNNFSIYLIGGIVRDLILGNKLFDIDIIVEGNAIDFAQILEKTVNCRITQTQNDLKTAKVLFENSVEVDFASTRCENYPSAGFLPVVDDIACSLKDDVSRRDFSINSMALSLNKKNRLQLVDYLDGYLDLKNKELRILHSNSFIDDPSRIIRGLKFAVRFGFNLEEKTKKLQNAYLCSKSNLKMPLERVKSELKQLFSLNSSEAYDELVSQKIYKLFSESPNLKTLGSQIKSIVDLFNVKKENIWLVYLGCLLINESENTLCRLNLSGKEQKILLDAKNMLSNKDLQKNDNYEIFEFYRNKDELSIIIYYILTDDFSVQVYLRDLKEIKLLINGEDLIKLGLKPSAQFNEIFKKVLKKKLNDGLKSKEEELEFLNLIL